MSATLFKFFEVIGDLGSEDARRSESLVILFIGLQWNYSYAR
jgi:hypothetical protein